MIDPLIHHRGFHPLLYWAVSRFKTRLTLPKRWLQGLLLYYFRYIEFVVLAMIANYLNFLFEPLSFFLLSKLPLESLLELTHGIVFIIEEGLWVISDIFWILFLRLVKRYRLAVIRQMLGCAENYFSWLRFLCLILTLREFRNQFFNFIRLAVFKLAT